MNHISLDRVGIDFSLGRNIVEEIVIYECRIHCEWTDGERGCCETWIHRTEGPRYSSVSGISERESMDLAGEDGWIIVCNVPICPAHYDDEDPDNATNHRGTGVDNERTK